MAADINTQLQNITTDVTAISNLVNRLVIIFSSGGVQNPDLAALKGELQGWTTTQLGNYVKLSGSQTLAGRYTFSSNYYDSIHVLAKFNPENTNFWNGIRFYGIDSSNNDLEIGSIRANASSSAFSIGLWPVHKGDSSAYSLGYSTNTAGQWYGECNIVGVPLDDSSNKIPNTAFINNVGNLLLHKTGEESARGRKKFLDGITTPIINLSSEQGELFGYVNQFTKSTTKGVCLSVETTGSYGHSIGIETDGNGSYSAFVQGMDFSCEGISPRVNNKNSCGANNHRWTEVFATTGTINTSDANLKTDILEIPDQVLEAISHVVFKQFVFKDAKEKKGLNARIHFGSIAQEIKNIFESKGIDPSRYGFFCYDTYPAEYEDVEVVDKPAVRGMIKVVDQDRIVAKNNVLQPDGTYKEEEVEVYPEKSHMEEGVIEPAVTHFEKRLVHEAGNIYSIRYEELLCAVVAYQSKKLATLDTRLSALEARLR